MRPVVNFTEIFGKMFTSQNVQNQIKLSTQFSTSFKSNFPKNVTKIQVLPSGKGTPNCGSGSPWMAVPKKHNIINKNTWISLIQRILAGWLFPTSSEFQALNIFNYYSWFHFGSFLWILFSLFVLILKAENTFQIFVNKQTNFNKAAWSDRDRVSTATEYCYVELS